MRFLQKKILRFVILVIPVLLLILVYLSTHDNLESLVVFKNNVTESAGAVVVLNLGTKKETSPKSSAVGCGALPVVEQVQYMDIYCIGQNASESHWILNLEKKTMHQNDTFVTAGAEIVVPAHPRIVQGTNGWRYYNAGGPVLFGENGNETTAHIVAVRGREIHVIPISDRMKPYKILRMTLDSQSKKLWIMSVGAPDSVLIDRIDTDTFAVDISLSLNAYLGFDVLVHDKFVFISTFRTDTGTDVMVLDKNSGETIKEITLPVNDERLNALSMVPYKNDILVSSFGGLFLLEFESLEIVDFIPNNPGGRFVNFVQSEKSIFGVSSYDQVIRMDKSNLMETAVVYEAPDEGITNVSYVVNKVPWREKLKGLY